MFFPDEGIVASYLTMSLLNNDDSFHVAISRDPLVGAARCIRGENGAAVLACVMSLTYADRLMGSGEPYGPYRR